MECVLTDLNLGGLSAAHSCKCSDDCVIFLLCDL
jgi:hypothetical protein